MAPVPCTKEMNWRRAAFDAYTVVERGLLALPLSYG